MKYILVIITICTLLSVRVFADPDNNWAKELKRNSEKIKTAVGGASPAYGEPCKKIINDVLGALNDQDEIRGPPNTYFMGSDAQVQRDQLVLILNATSLSGFVMSPDAAQTFLNRLNPAQRNFVNGFELITKTEPDNVNSSVAIDFQRLAMVLNTPMDQMIRRLAEGDVETYNRFLLSDFFQNQNIRDMARIRDHVKPIITGFLAQTLNVSQQEITGILGFYDTKNTLGYSLAGLVTADSAAAFLLKLTGRSLDEAIERSPGFAKLLGAISETTGMDLSPGVPQVWTDANRNISADQKQNLLTLIATGVKSDPFLQRYFDQNALEAIKTYLAKRDATYPGLMGMLGQGSNMLSEFATATFDGNAPVTEAHKKIIADAINAAYAQGRIPGNISQNMLTNGIAKIFKTKNITYDQALGGIKDFFSAQLQPLINDFIASGKEFLPKILALILKWLTSSAVPPDVNRSVAAAVSINKSSTKESIDKKKLIIKKEEKKDKDCGFMDPDCPGFDSMSDPMGHGD